MPPPGPVFERDISPEMTETRTTRIYSKVSNSSATVRATPKPASSMAHSTVTRALALWAHT